MGRAGAGADKRRSFCILSTTQNGSEGDNGADEDGDAYTWRLTAWRNRARMQMGVQMGATARGAAACDSVELEFFNSKKSDSWG